MEGWKEVQLRSVCTIDKKKYEGSSLPYVGMENIVSGRGILTDEDLATHVKSSSFQFDQRHLLYGRLRPYLNKVLLPDFQGHCSTEIFPLLCSEELDRRFLFYWLTREETVERIDRTSTGARMPRADVNEVMTFALPLPPLPTQRRIVAILDEAFAAIDRAIGNVERNLGNVEELWESYLGAVFETGSSRWQVVSIGEIADHCLGKMLDKRKNKGDLHPYLRNSSVRWFDFDLSDLKEMRFEAEEAERYTAHKGDLLICEGGYPGRAAIWQGHQPIYFQKAIHRVRFKNPAHAKWFLYYLYFMDLSGAIQEYFTGTGIQHFTGKSLSGVTVPLPPTTELSVLTEKIEWMHTQIDQISRILELKKEALTSLKQSLLHQAFTGQLTSAREVEEEMAEAGV